MPTPTIPSRLVPESGRLAINEPGGVMRDQVEGGVPNYAMVWDRGTQKFSVSITMSPSQLTAWTLFYHLIIFKGSVPFFMPLDSGAGVANHLVYVEPGSYSSSRDGPMITIVEFTVEAESSVYA